MTDQTTLQKHSTQSKFQSITSETANTTVASAMHTVTVDELSYRLKRAARKTHHGYSTGEATISSRLPARNDVAGALEYVNKRFCVGIDALGLAHLREDARACILFDLAHMPLPMVIERLQSEGAFVN